MEKMCFVFAVQPAADLAFIVERNQFDLNMIRRLLAYAIALERLK